MLHFYWNCGSLRKTEGWCGKLLRFAWHSRLGPRVVEARNAHYWGLDMAVTLVICGPK